MRVQKVSGSTTTVYIFSGSNVIAEYDNGAPPAAPSREYIYSGGALLARIGSVDVRFTNDSCSGCGGNPVGGGDRNLFINSITVGSTTIYPNDPSVSYVTPPCDSYSGGVGALYCNGDMITTSPTAEIAQSVTVNAYGSPDYNIYPHVQLLVGGVLVGQWYITVTAQNYTANLQSTGTQYFSGDNLSNRMVTDSSGNKVAEMGTFPYGESWYNATNDKLLFTTYERDSESGNDYAQARYNINRLGRFSSPDLIAGGISDPQSLNRYSYVRNMPVLLTDPSGLISICNTVKNHDANQQQDSKGGGPSAPSAEGDAAEPDPQGPGCGWPTAGGDGVWVDWGFASDDSGLGVGAPAFDGAILLGRSSPITEYGEWSWIYAFLSNFPGSSPGDPQGGGSAGTNKNCNFNVAINNATNMSAASVAAIEDQIKAVFAATPLKDGSTVGINFTFSGKPDTTLNLSGGIVGALFGLISVYGNSTAMSNPTVYVNAVYHDYVSDYRRVDGIVAAHELTHKLGDIRNQPWDANNPNLMNLGNTPSMNSLLRGPGLPTGLRLTADQIKTLLDACKHKPNS